MMTRLLISSSLVFAGATYVAAQDATQDQDQDRMQGELQIRTDEAQPAGDRQQDQATQLQQGQTGRDAAGGQAREGQKMKAEDVLKEMASANQLEVQLGELAQDRAQDQQVQQFARQMVQHHQQALERIKRTAQQKDVQVSEDQLQEHHQVVLDKLKDKQGEQFEAAYMFHQAGKHVQDILMAQHVATASEDQELQQLARQELPMLQQHLQQATDIAQNIAGGGQAMPAGAEIQPQGQETQQQGLDRPADPQFNGVQPQGQQPETQDMQERRQELGDVPDIEQGQAAQPGEQRGETPANTATDNAADQGAQPNTGNAPTR